MRTFHSRENNLILAKEWFYRGRRAQEQEEKLYCYDRSLRLNPYHIYAWNSKGNVLYTLGRFEEALGCYDKALELNCNFAKAWGGKGNTLKRLGKNAEAIRCYDKSIFFFYDNPYVWNGKGDALSNIGKCKDAIKCYDRAIKLKKDLSYPWNGKGFALYKLGFYEEAVSSFDQAIKIDPIFHYSWFGRGNSLLKLERYEEAINCYENVLKVNPEFEGIVERKTRAEDDLKSKSSCLNVSKAEVQQLQRSLIQSVTNLVIFYSKADNKPEVLKRLRQLKEYAGDHKRDLESSISQIEYLVKNNIPLEVSFIEGLTVLLYKIEHEVETKSTEWKS